MACTPPDVNRSIFCLLNELFTEFYIIVAVVVSGIILRESTVVTLLSSALTWETLPSFLLVKSIPEVLDAWFIVVYLRYVGIDWWGFGRSLVCVVNHGRFKCTKLLSLAGIYW